ncbi:MAG: FliH/SctL family protein [Opitutales bacterium]
MPKAKRYSRKICVGRPVGSVRVVRSAEPPVEAAEVQRLCDAARAQGRASVEETCAHQIHQTREEMLHLHEQVLSAIEQSFAGLKRDISQRLPDLVLALAEQVVGALPSDADMLRRVVEKHLEEAAPGDAKVEVLLNPDDHALMAGLDAELQTRYPQLAFRENADLQPGDCQVSTRFGLIDARRETKLRNLRNQIAG